jgi:NitT/TauT family transport system permease protein
MKSAKKFSSLPWQTKLKEVVFNRWMAVTIVAAAFLVWEILAREELISKLFFPPPTTIGATLAELIRTGELFARLLPTLQRLLIGFLIGGSVGLVMGLSMGWSKTLRKALDPIIAALHPVPKITMLPLILIIFGIGETSRIFVISLAAFFPMLINSMSGVLEINENLFEVMRNYHASRFQVFRQLILPGSLPFVLTGVRLSLNRALVISIAMEMIFSNEGLGEMIWFAWQTFRIEELYAGIFTISIVGMGLSALVRVLTQYLTPWSEDA